MQGELARVLRVGLTFLFLNLFSPSKHRRRGRQSPGRNRLAHYSLQNGSRAISNWSSDASDAIHAKGVKELGRWTRRRFSRVAFLLDALAPHESALLLELFPHRCSSK